MSIGAIEDEVRHRLTTDRHYPLGEPDAMKWAIAFRILTLERRGTKIDMPLGDLDGLMCGWFANAMATQEMIDRGGSFLNADGMQAVMDGEAVDPASYFARWRGEPAQTPPGDEIVGLAERLPMLTKAYHDAFNRYGAFDPRTERAMRRMHDAEDARARAALLEDRK